MLKRTLTTFLALLIKLTSATKITHAPLETDTTAKVVLQDLAQAGGAGNEKKVGRTDILTAPTGSKILEFALPKNNKIVAITDKNTISIKAITANPSTTTQEDVTIDKNMVDFSETGSVDCWNHNEICVVCGYKGCVTINVKDANHAFLRYWYHNVYEYTHTSKGLRKTDIYHVRVLKNTAYFYTAESMAGTKSAGLSRWDTNSGKDACHDSWSAKFHDLEGTDNYEYFVYPIPYTNAVALSSTGYGRIWIFNNGDIRKPWITLRVSPLTNGAGYLTEKITSVGLPSDTLMVSCNRYISDKFCFSFNYTDNKIRYTYRTNKLSRETSIPAKISLVNIPQSYIFVVSYAKRLYIFNEESSATEAIDGNQKINRWWEDSTANSYTPVNFVEIRDEEHYNFFMLATDTKVRWIRFYEPAITAPTHAQAAAPNNNHQLCHRNCFKDTLKVDAVCDRYLFRAQHCKIYQCASTIGVNSYPNYKMTRMQNGPMKCVNPEMDLYKNSVVGTRTADTNKYYSPTPYHLTSYLNTSRVKCTNNSKVNYVSPSKAAVLNVLGAVALFVGLMKL